MKITFLMPCYMWGPSGGYRVVYEYANRLVSRGHGVSVVHARKLKFPPPPEQTSFRMRLRLAMTRAIELVSTPSVNWHPIDPRVEMLFVPSSDQRFIPDADVIFATAWHTVRSVLECAPAKGEKCYLIQHHETFLGPEDLVDSTWKLPLHKVVVSRWLVQIGNELGSSNITYIPNGIDQTRYSLKMPIAGRRPRVAMMFSTVPFKGCRDGIEALDICRRQYPNLQATLFGKNRRKDWVPHWVEYYRDPDQQFIVDEIYNKSSIFLSPSWSEGFALPPAEAASCGCAVVATDSGGIHEYVEDGASGLLSKPRDPAALAANLCRLLENDDLRTRLAIAANTEVKRLDWERSADRMENFLMKATGKSRVRDEEIRLPSSRNAISEQLRKEIS